MALQQPQGGEVEHAVRTFQRRLQDVCLHDVAANFADSDARILQGSGEIFAAAANHVVVDHDLPDRLLQELLHRVRADQARASDHHEFLALEIH